MGCGRGRSGPAHCRAAVRPAGLGGVRADRGWRLLVAAGVLAGLALRLWMLTGRPGVLDSDEAIVGLMARHFLDGDWTTFYWGQAYGGSQEAMLTAAVFAVTG